MLKFMRNKLVGVERRGPDKIVVSGILDDDIYSLEIELRVRLSDLRIISIDGKWRRWTTPECPRAIEPLKEAIGFCINEEGLYEKIRRQIGKLSCRHFANLLIECCDTVRSAKDFILEELKKDSKKETQLNISDFFPSCQKKKEGTLIDLHVHTYPASSCASSSIEEQIAEAKKAGLDGICITDHNYLWDMAKIEDLRERYNFLVLAGTEITTDEGDILVFGIKKMPPYRGIVRIEELRSLVKDSGGFMIAAHPFRGFLISGVESLGLTPERAAQRKLFSFVDAIEVLNGRVNVGENIFTKKVAEICRLPATGGSDAHETKEIGIYATYFEQRIRNEKELVDALKNGTYSACILRGHQFGSFSHEDKKGLGKDSKKNGAASKT